MEKNFNPRRYPSPPLYFEYYHFDNLIIFHWINKNNLSPGQVEQKEQVNWDRRKLLHSNLSSKKEPVPDYVMWIVFCPVVSLFMDRFL